MEAFTNDPLFIRPYVDFLIADQKWYEHLPSEININVAAEKLTQKKEKKDIFFSPASTLKHKFKNKKFAFKSQTLRNKKYLFDPLLNFDINSTDSLELERNGKKNFSNDVLSFKINFKRASFLYYFFTSSKLTFK